METRMKQARKFKKMTLKEVAELVGVTESAVSKYECNRAIPSDAVIRLFCEKLHISETWLRTGEGEMEEQTPASLVDALAKEYDLNPGCVALLRAVAHAFEALDDVQFNLILDRLMSDLQTYTANRQIAGVTAPAPQAPAEEEDSSSASSGSIVG